ncbi:hypothetical protein [Nocardioides sp. GY 10127]|uniref:hypothetical protein n=1 Tax=Nocardioides sp. GY 10127 TaxID=2569762 RepID=UPI0010A7A302|nr:hypothetical protein [Nocardioides sp. GY 10127]TIC82966.1 hypothetical protein E8D37_10000 [Nocardioides sp. GY 10127]
MTALRGRAAVPPRRRTGATFRALGLALAGALCLVGFTALPASASVGTTYIEGDIVGGSVVTGVIPSGTGDVDIMNFNYYSTLAACEADPSRNAAQRVVSGSTTTTLPTTGAAVAFSWVNAAHTMAGSSVCYEFTDAPPVFTTSPTVALDGPPQVDVSVAAAVTGGDPAADVTTKTYQWTLDGDDIDGATSATYTPVPSDAGHDLAVSVTSSVDGYVDDLTSSVESMVAKGAASAVDAPTITGPAVAWSTLTCTSEELDATYRWLVGDEEVGTGSTYMVWPDDVGSAITCEVTVARDGYEDAVATADSAVAVRATLPPYTLTLSGHAVVGGTITATGQQQAPRTSVRVSPRSTSSTTWKWLRDGKVIRKAIPFNTYTPVAADYGHTITAVMIVKDMGYKTARAEATSEVVGVKGLQVSAPEKVAAGRKVTVTISNLVPGEDWTLALGNGSWSRSGTASARTTERALTVTLPKRLSYTGARRLVLTQGERTAATGFTFTNG